MSSPITTSFGTRVREDDECVVCVTIEQEDGQRMAVELDSAELVDKWIEQLDRCKAEAWPAMLDGWNDDDGEDATDDKGTDQFIQGTEHPTPE